MSSPLFVCIGLVWLLAFSACGPSARETPAPATPEATPSQPATPTTGSDEETEQAPFEGTGFVRNIMPSRTFIVLRHGTIEGYMDAMDSMPFQVQDTSLLSGIQRDDSVRFSVTARGVVTAISKIE